MSALGEYYRGMGAAAMDQAQAAHESAAASQTGANAQMVGQQGQAALHRAQAEMVQPLGESEIRLQSAQGGYYGAQSNLANAQVVGQQGQAALHRAQAEMVRPLGESEIRLQSAQGGYYGAQSNLANENAKMVRPLGQSTIGYQGAMGSAALMHGRAAGVSAGAAMQNADTLRMGTESDIRTKDQGSGEFSSGTSRVSAPGDGTADTTKAKLANGEAVLNRGAAEHLGQPAIQALNAVGMLRMGMVPGSNTQAPQVKEANAAQTAGKTGAQGYAKGVSKAGSKKAAPAKDDKSAPKDAKSGGAKPSDTPPLDQIDPKMLAAAMQMGLMGQQGGGMPPPQGAPMGAPPQGAPMGMM